MTGARDDTDAAAVFGYFLAGIGGLAAQVATIALGVRLGVDDLIE